MLVVLDGVFKQNHTYDYDEDYENFDEPEHAVQKSVWIPLLYSLLLIVGLVGNGLLLTVLALKSRFWSLSDSIILQLALVDFLLLVTLPFYAAHASHSCGWCSLTFFTVCGAVFKINLYVGIFLLACICLDLYLSILFAGWYRSRRASVLFFSWLLVWLISIVLTALDSKFLRTTTDSMPGKALSAHSHPKSGVNMMLFSRGLHLAVGFLLPAIVLIVLCSQIMLRRRENGEQRKRPVLLTLCLVAVFLLCWTPYNITLLIDTIAYTSEDFFRKMLVYPVDSLKAAIRGTSAVGCVSACLRPLLYFFICENFRRATFSLFKCANLDQRSSFWELGVHEEARPDQCISEGELRQMTTTTTTTTS